MWAQARPDPSPPLYPRSFPEPLQGWKRTLPDRNGVDEPGDVQLKPGEEQAPEPRMRIWLLFHWAVLPPWVIYIKACPA